MKPFLNSIKGVEIFRAGIHNGDSYTEQDIDDMVSAFKELDFRPALKCGHTKDQPGAPAYGWVANLRKEGGKLIADFEDMHDSVVDAIRKRTFPSVSSEIYFNLKRGGKLFRRALKAVALLGTEVPAVAGLKPLHKMEFAAEGFDSVAACAQGLEVRQQAIIDSLTARLTGMDQLFTEQKEQDAMTIKELREKKATLEAEIAALKQKGDKMTDEDRVKITSLDGQIKEFGQKMDAEFERLERAERENADLRTTVQALQAQDRRRDVEQRVARCTVKSFHATLDGLYAHAVANPTVKVKHFATDSKGTRTESERSLTESLDALVGQINESAKRLFVVEAGRPGTRMPETPPSDMDAGVEVDRRAKERVADGKSKSYEEALDAVLAGDAELARAYAEQQASASYANRP